MGYDRRLLDTLKAAVVHRYADLGTGALLVEMVAASDKPLSRIYKDLIDLDRVAKAHGQECHEVPVGFKYICWKMTETDAVIGSTGSSSCSSAPSR